MSIERVLQRYWLVGLLECYWHSEPEIGMDIMITPIRQQAGKSCADPENIVREGIIDFFLVDEGRYH